jgi:hypothetical protein
MATRRNTLQLLHRWGAVMAGETASRMVDGSAGLMCGCTDEFGDGKRRGGILVDVAEEELVGGWIGCKVRLRRGYGDYGRDRG